MTLPEFFRDLAKTVDELPIDEPMPFPAGFHTRKHWVIGYLGQIATIAELPEEKWFAASGASQQLWSGVLPYLTKWQVFEKYKGDAETRELLKRFLKPTAK